MNKGVILSFSLAVVLCVLYPAFAEPAAVVVDDEGAQVTLSSIETREIEFSVGNGTLTVPVDSIRSLARDQDGESLILKTLSGKQLKGKSESTLEGTWDLGKYSISLSHVKSVDFEQVAAPSRGTTEEGESNTGATTPVVVVQQVPVFVQQVPVVVQQVPVVVAAPPVVVNVGPLVFGPPRPAPFFWAGGYFGTCGALSLSFYGHWGGGVPHVHHQAFGWGHIGHVRTLHWRGRPYRR